MNFNDMKLTTENTENTESERPTPKTDASIIERRHIHKSDGSVQLVELIDAEFARRLERELDEARQDAERWESSSDAMERAGADQARRADENREWALKAERERDELKEALLIMENLLKPGIELFPEIGEILKQGAK